MKQDCLIKLTKHKNIFFFLLTCLTLHLVSCVSFLKYPAIPEEPMNISDELKYIDETDQRDRRQNLLRFIFTSEKKIYTKEKIIAVSDRDSIRLTRVIELHKKGLIKTDADKYYSAYSYFHGGGLKMKEDTTYFRIAYELFKDLGENASDEKWKKEGKYYTPLSYNRWQEQLKKFKDK